MEDVIIFFIIVLLLAIVMLRLLCAAIRRGYYEQVSEAFGKLAYEVDSKNKEFVFEVIHYMNSSYQDKTSIIEFRKGVTRMIESYQKKDKLTDSVASRVLDIVYEKWEERPFRSLYFIDKKIIDSKMNV